MPFDQSDVFVRSEANAWFTRNREALEKFDPARDLALRLIDLYGLRPRRVLEIGACTGMRLAALAERTGAMTVAVEPSAAAIAYGRVQFPGVRFVRGRAEAVALRAAFDLVIVNYVLHWIDRDALLGVVGEIDRLVKDGGWLVIGDFHPANRMALPYHHLPDGQVVTYKQDYAAVFTASGVYRPIATLEGDHITGRLDAALPSIDRGAATLLGKSLTGGYVNVPYP